MDALPVHWLRTHHGALQVFEHGGHIATWTPHGRAPVLWLSPQSRFAPGEAIRGGIPVIFPWFGDDPERRGRPAHGFARRIPWRLVELAAAHAQFESTDDAHTRSLWPHAFAMRLGVEITAALTITLTIHNRDQSPFRCEPALHTYFAVGDVRQARVHGLEGVTFLDKVDGMKRKVQSAAPLTLTGETDRVFVGAPARLEIEDPVLMRRIRVSTIGLRSAIVWNPGAAKAAKMGDVGDAWSGFLCAESGNVAEDALTIAAGDSAMMQLRIEV